MSGGDLDNQRGKDLKPQLPEGREVSSGALLGAVGKQQRLELSGLRSRPTPGTTPIGPSRGHATQDAQHRCPGHECTAASLPVLCGSSGCELTLKVCTAQPRKASSCPLSSSPSPVGAI